MIAVRVRSYDQLRAALSARRRELGLRQLEADEKSGLMSGYVAKDKAGVRKLGDLSLPMLLAGLDCDLYLAARPSAPAHPPNGARISTPAPRAQPGAAET